MYASTGFVKSKKGTLLQRKKNQRWKEYIEELFHDEIRKPTIHKNIEGPKLLMSAEK